MTRKQISEILPEITDDQMGKLLNLFHGEVDVLKDEKDGMQNELQKIRDELTAAGQAREKAEKDLTDYKAEQGRRESAGKAREAYRTLLREQGVSEKYFNLIMKDPALEKMELGEDGKLVGAEKLAEGIRSEYADFIQHTETRGVQVETPPAGKVTKTKEEIMAIKDAGARQAAIAENHELFGF